VTRTVRPRSEKARDPYGIGPVGSMIGPIVSVVGLILIAVVTINLFDYNLPLLGGGGGNGGNGGGAVAGPELTPAPSNVIVVPKEARFLGKIVYAKAGNIWVQSDEGATQLTNGGGASMPSFSPDGNWVYYVHDTPTRGKWPRRGTSTWYDIDLNELFRIRADGSAQPQRLLSGQVRSGSNRWSAWIRQPVVSPDGKTVALVTDAPRPDDSNVVLQFYDLARDRLTRAGVPEVGVLGHQDPEWRPDGKMLLYTMNDRDGAKGAPVIMRYDPKTKAARALTTRGYMQPSYSPDGRFIAATRTNALGTDVVILNAGNGNELSRITNDDTSWAPVWSPAGDAIAFLRLDGAIADLFEVKLDGTPGNWTKGDETQLTEVSGLDAASRPGWFIPPSELPAPSVAPTSSAGPSAPASTAP
jgi:Tol biopolymer transport system component